MVTLRQSFTCGRNILDIAVDGMLRFNAVEHKGFLGGWNLYALHSNILIERFDTIEEIETYVDEMDK